MRAVPYADALLMKASRKAVAIGRNYALHAAELGSSVPTEPFWFFKPSSSYLATNSGPILLPRGAVVHHEVELGVVIKKPARDVPANRATDYIAGYICAIDITARNWQNEDKDAGRPWSRSKGCDTFLPISKIVAPELIPLDPNTGSVSVELFLSVNGEARQKGSTSDMIFPIPKLIEHITSHVTLDEWDLILTGTPAGVGPIKHGDVVTAGISSLVDMEFTVEDRKPPQHE